MYPEPLWLFGFLWSTWNILFLVGVVAGYFVLRRTYTANSQPPPLGFLVRYAICVYICALGAQWFAYAVDANTTLLPPPGFSAWRYYLNPLAGPKTLYGTVLVLPLAAVVAFTPLRGIRWSTALNLATPALFTILGFARIGCFLQGCCYGLRSDHFGLSFRPGSGVHSDQFLAGLVRIDQPSLAVLPTQIVSALACFGLAVWSARGLDRQTPDIYIRTVAAYSGFRLAIEFFRADAVRNHVWLLSTSQLVAIFILSALAIRAQIHRRS